MDKKKYLPILTGLIYASIFGLSFIFTKIALDRMSLMELLASRFLIAATSMTLLKLTGIIKIDLKNKPRKDIILVAIFQPVLYFTFETIGINMTTASESGLMTSLTPIVVSILSVIFLKERLRLHQWGFIILSVSGVVLINLMKGSVAPSNYLGVFFLLLTVLVAGIYNILAKKATAAYQPIEITYVMMWAGAIVFNGVNIVNSIINKNISTYFSRLFAIDALVPLLYLGVLSSIFAFFLSVYTISKLQVSQAAVFGNVITIVSIIGGVIILKENFHWYDFVGGLMIIVGVWATVYYGEDNKRLPDNEEEIQSSLSQENSLI